MSPWRWRHRRGTLHGLPQRPAIMAILNLTPDSFSDGGRFSHETEALRAGVAAVEAGAEILDLGAESTRPGAAPVDETEEIRRLLPVLRLLRRETGALLSVDTSKASVARAAADEGADILNDISGGTFDPRMLETVASSGLGFVAMHTTGTPQVMQERAHYDDVAEEVTAALRARFHDAVRAGIAADAVMLDPGFGFGKLLSHNLSLFGALPTLATLPRPLVVGVSRKSMLRAVAGTATENLEHATTTANLLASLGGAAVLRTHNVAAAVAMRSTLLHLGAQSK